MKAILEMTLLTDAVFGNGASVPGGEDISVLCDSEGFPYYKGGTFKGIFREELENYLSWEPGCSENPISVDERLGSGGDNEDAAGKIRFYDFVIPSNVKALIREDIHDPDDVLGAFTYLRTFTKLDSNGLVEKNMLRSCRCLKEGITFEGAIEYVEADKKWIEEVINLIKWVGTMRNRGFGKVIIKMH